MTAHHYLLFFLLFFFATTFVLPSWQVWRQTGINPVVLPENDSAYGFVGRVFRLLMALVLLCVSANAFWPAQLAGFFPPFDFPAAEAFAIAGWVLLFGSWLLVVAAQRSMRQSWRIGIDTEHRTELVQSGLFSFSRNPIFLGILLSLLGLFLVLPNAVTLLVLVLGWVVISVQIRLEEAFLEQQHGESYQEYWRKVRRWF